MQKPSENAKPLGKKLRLNEDKAFAVAIIVGLLIVSVAVLSYFVWFAPQPEPFNNIYLLDQNKKALDYPQTLTVNHNSTFVAYVDVVNHIGKIASYKIEMKITKNLSSFPVDVPASQTILIDSLGDGKTNENMVTVTENTAGSYSVVFELWEQNPTSGEYNFTGNYCNLNIQVIG
jgi:uncharacterized membrane protein